jgi:hypothetical protein
VGRHDIEEVDDGRRELDVDGIVGVGLAEEREEGGKVSGGVLGRLLLVQRRLDGVEDRDRLGSKVNQGDVLGERLWGRGGRRTFCWLCRPGDLILSSFSWSVGTAMVVLGARVCLEMVVCSNFFSHPRWTDSLIDRRVWGPGWAMC